MRGFHPVTADRIASVSAYVGLISAVQTLEQTHFSSSHTKTKKKRNKKKHCNDFVGFWAPFTPST